jgi:hypothetical protein
MSAGAAMRDNVVRLSEYRGRLPGARPTRRLAGPRARKGIELTPTDLMIGIVEPVPPDLFAITLPRALWPALSDWLAEQAVLVQGDVEPHRP